MITIYSVEVYILKATFPLNYDNQEYLIGIFKIKCDVLANKFA